MRTFGFIALLVNVIVILAKQAHKQFRSLSVRRTCAGKFRAKPGFVDQRRRLQSVARWLPVCSSWVTVFTPLVTLPCSSFYQAKVP